MRLLPQSLRLRVLFYVFSTTLLSMLLLGSLIFQQISALTTSLTQEQLLEQAKRIASFIEYDWRGRFDLDLPRRHINYYSNSDTHQYAVMTAGGEILFQSDGFMRERIANTLDKGGKHYFRFEDEEGRVFSGIKYDYLFEDKIYPIYIIEYENEFAAIISALESDFLQNILYFGVPLLLFQGLLIMLIFRDAFNPILKASRDAENITFKNMSYRLDEKDVHAEMLPLIRSINTSLERLEKSVQAQKFFIANAAHELRTPIAILKTRIASLKDEAEIYILNEDLRNINRLISQMLDISRLDASENHEQSDISLNILTQRACADIGELYISAGKELSLIEKQKNVHITGNEEILYRAVLNLLENALKHTPSNTPVKAIIGDKSITIRDYGNPISSENSLKIFDAFEKAPDQIQTRGSGLGLAIVKKSAELHGATISLEPRKDGNDFILRF